MKEFTKLTRNLKAEEALGCLDQAWAYYTPEKRPVCLSPVYEDLPLAG